MTCVSRVVVLWRPDTTTDRPPATPDKPYLTWIGGQWASDHKIYPRDQLPSSGYRGQDTWPNVPHFERFADAAAYLTESRDHTACQLALDEFESCFPEIELTEA